MKTFASLMLLVSVFVVSFVNRAYIGLPLYFGMFALMPLWVWLFYAGGYRVTPAQVEKVRKEPFRYSFMAIRSNRLQGQSEYAWKTPSRPLRAGLVHRGRPASFLCLGEGGDGA